MKKKKTIAYEMNENKIPMRKLASQLYTNCRHRHGNRIFHMQEAVPVLIVLLSTFTVQAYIADNSKCKRNIFKNTLKFEIEFRHKHFATNQTRMPQHVN